MRRAEASSGRARFNNRASPEGTLPREQPVQHVHVVNSAAALFVAAALVCYMTGCAALNKTIGSITGQTNSIPGIEIKFGN
jgi:hypothetical protein